MIRCPSCGQANPEHSGPCTRCGARLPVRGKAGWTLNQWLDPLAMFKAALAALPLMLVYAAIFEWAFFPLPRAESRLLIYNLALGLGLSAGVGWLRAAAWKQAPLWLFYGLAAGLGAYAADFIYNYQHLIYKAVFFAADLVNPFNSVIFPYRLLQGLRYFGACLVLGLLLYRKEGDWRAWLWYLFCALVGACVRSQVWGRPMDAAALERASGVFAWAPGPGDWMRLWHLGLYFLSLWCVLYGLGRRAPGKV